MSVRLHMSRKRFTAKQIETAVEVLSQAKICQLWAEGQARFFEIDPQSAAWQSFMDRNSKVHARHLLRDVIET